MFAQSIEKSTCIPANFKRFAFLVHSSYPLSGNISDVISAQIRSKLQSAMPSERSVLQATDSITGGGVGGGGVGLGVGGIGVGLATGSGEGIGVGTNSDSESEYSNSV